MNTAAFDKPAVPRDKDGFIIPEVWRGRPDKWESLPFATRRSGNAFEEAKLAKPEKKLRDHNPGATRFTTDYAIKWGRKQGWKLIDRENYNHRTQNHHDLMLGLDALFDDGGDGMVGIQGAGRGERKEHYQRFCDRGGVDRAKRRHIRVLYLEFERGKFDPILREEWA